MSHNVETRRMIRTKYRSRGDITIPHVGRSVRCIAWVSSKERWRDFEEVGLEFLLAILLPPNMAVLIDGRP